MWRQHADSSLLGAVQPILTGDASHRCHMPRRADSSAVAKRA
jgi:hypothetical protein